MSGQSGLSQQSKHIKNPSEVLSPTGQESSPSKKFVRPDFAPRSPENKTHSSTASKPEFTRVFDAQVHREEFDNKNRIADLLAHIRREVTSARAQGTALSAELDRIENATLQPAPNKVGIYHIEYYKLLLDYVTNIRKNMTASMWRYAAANKQKAKRGGAISRKVSDEAPVARSSN